MAKIRTKVKCHVFMAHSAHLYSPWKAANKYKIKDKLNYSSLLSQQVFSQPKCWSWEEWIPVAKINLWLLINFSAWTGEDKWKKSSFQLTSWNKSTVYWYIHWKQIAQVISNTQRGAKLSDIPLFHCVITCNVILITMLQQWLHKHPIA